MPWSKKVLTDDTDLLWFKCFIQVCAYLWKSARLKVTSMRKIRGNKLLLIQVIFLPSVLKTQEKQGPAPKNSPISYPIPLQAWSVCPFKNNVDYGIGTYHRSKYRVSSNSEMTFNWNANTTTGFLNPLVAGVTKLGKQAVSLGVGPRIPLIGQLADFGFRGVLTLVFPK